MKILMVIRALGLAAALTILLAGVASASAYLLAAVWSNLEMPLLLGLAAQFAIVGFAVHIIRRLWAFFTRLITSGSEGERYEKTS